MAPTLAAAVQDETKSVALTVTGATGTIRVNAYAGTFNYQVRGTFANGRATVDYDVPLNVDVVYIATDNAGQSPQVTVHIDSDTSFLSVMSSPVIIAPVIVLADENQTYEGRSTPHKILGSNIPLVTVEPPAFRSGTYRFHVPTSDGWEELRSVILTGAVCLLRSPCPSEFRDTSFIIIRATNDLRWSSPAPRHRLVAFDYQAVAPDTQPAADLAWTWADVPPAAATWADVATVAATWGELATHVPPGP